MKSILKAVPVLLALVFANSASAAVAIDLGTIGTTVPPGTSVSFSSKEFFGIDPSVDGNGVITGPFEHVLNFTVGPNSGVVGLATNIFSVDPISSNNELANLHGDIDGQDLSLTTDSFGNIFLQILTNAATPFVLAPGQHSLSIFGEGVGSGGSYSGSINVVPAAVPVPAAIWLLGSALTGIVTVGRRRVA